MRKWIDSENISDLLKNQIKEYSEEEYAEAFSEVLAFGTAGMRGKMGAGTSRMNEVMIRWATTGYAKYILKNNLKNGIVIAYDNRLNSDLFSLQCANLLSSYGIKVYLFNAMRSTPQLSYTIRKLNASGGINITASHNPKTDNGYKLYNEHGCQYLPEDIIEIKKFIDEVKDPASINILEANEDLIVYLNDDTDFINMVISTTNLVKSDVRIVFTPLHGTASTVIKPILNMIGFTNVNLLDEQMTKDANFRTCPSPNPESDEAYDLALSTYPNAHYILATDPDADRVGIYDNINKKRLSGNEMAVLLTDYLISENDANKTIVGSVVSSKLPFEIAKKQGLNTKVVLTGFKYIGTAMDELKDKFFLGFEESNGYLFHTNVRDKDGISTCVKFIEMINKYHNEGLTLQERLNQIYEEYGYYYEATDNLYLSKEEMEKFLSRFKDLQLDSIANLIAVDNYFNLTKTTKDGVTQLDLEKSDMIIMHFKNGCEVAIRPSGTEPKVKVYYNLKAKDLKTCQNYLQEYKKIISEE